MNIVRAQPADAATLTDIAFAAKRHWGYPEKWLESWRDLLTIRPEFVVSHARHILILDGCMIGFYAVSSKGERLELVHLWVLPEAMGRSVGRALFNHCVQHARELGCRELEIESDPHAEGFYRRMGAQRAGVNISDLDGQPRKLPVLIYQIEQGTA